MYLPNNAFTSQRKAHLTCISQPCIMGLILLLYRNYTAIHFARVFRSLSIHCAPCQRLALGKLEIALDENPLKRENYGPQLVSKVATLFLPFSKTTKEDYPCCARATSCLKVRMKKITAAG